MRNFEKKWIFSRKCKIFEIMDLFLLNIYTGKYLCIYSSRIKFDENRHAVEIHHIIYYSYKSKEVHMWERDTYEFVGMANVLR